MLNILLKCTKIQVKTQCETTYSHDTQAVLGMRILCSPTSLSSFVHAANLELQQSPPEIVSLIITV
jgi:hypothetical protein